MMDKKSLQTAVETPEFIRQAKICMEDEAKNQFIDYIAKNPLDGDLISGTGGARKIRWMASPHKGKRGGVRVIYYYHHEGMPIFLFTVYEKNQKANISQAERNALRGVIRDIVELYEG